MTLVRFARSAKSRPHTTRSSAPFKIYPIDSLDSFRVMRLQRNIVRLLTHYPAAAAVVEHWVSCLLEHLDKAA